MPIITLTKAQLLDGALLPPDWYDLVIKEVRAQAAKSGNSINYFVTFIVDSHDAKPEVTIMYTQMNMDKFKQMYAASQNKSVQQLVDETEVALSFDTDDIEGTRIKGNLIHETRKDTGNIQNGFSEYLPQGTVNPL